MNSSQIKIASTVNSALNKSEIVHHSGGLIENMRAFKIPWRHNVDIFNKAKTIYFIYT